MSAPGCGDRIDLAGDDAIELHSSVNHDDGNPPQVNLYGVSAAGHDVTFSIQMNTTQANRVVELLLGSLEMIQDWEDEADAATRQ